MCEIDWSAIANWASAAGSLGAVIVALYLAGQAARDQQKRDRRAERASAEKLLLKLTQVLSGTRLIDLYLRPQGDLSCPVKQDRWKHVQPLAGLDEERPPTLSPDEFSVLLAAGTPELAAEIELLMRRYAASLTFMKDYRRERDSLLARLPAPFEQDGLSASVALDLEQMQRFSIVGATLDQLLHDMTNHGAVDRKMANDLARRFTDTCRQYFADPKFYSLSEVDAVNPKPPSSSATAPA